ncbi:MAG: hypothetical protein PF517_01540 [Salinivirgaceae bacterium]|jgi:hypothetical protein|nr:hypothetical protein [Salinivirgaceae bacterium]
MLKNILARNLIFRKVSKGIYFHAFRYGGTGTVFPNLAGTGCCDPEGFRDEI